MTAAPLRLILGFLVALAHCLPSSATAARHVPHPRPDMLGRAVLRLVFFWSYSEAGSVLVATAETSADGLRTRSISFGQTNAN